MRSTPYPIPKLRQPIGANMILRAILASSLILLAGCERNISGEVFIVTNNGTAMKLALVDVAALTEKQASECVRIKLPKWKRDIETVTSTLDAAMKTSGEADNALAQADRKLVAATEILKQSTHTLTIADETKNQNIIRKALKFTNERKAEGEKIFGEFQAAQAAKQTADATLLSANKNRDAFLNGAFQMDCATNAAIVSSTNADGQFQIRAPSGRIALLVATKRSIIEDTEEYYWFVWVDEKTDRATLSNNNLFPTACPACVVKLSDVVLTSK